MKKLIICILAILYIGSSTGATIHMHYCMGKLVDMGLWHGKKASACKKCGTKENTSCKKKCCKDVHKLVKLDKDQKTAESTFQLVALTSLVTLNNNFYDLSLTPVVALAQEYPVTTGPPRSSKVQPYIFLCTFRI